jgi:hypothetical protein
LTTPPSAAVLALGALLGLACGVGGPLERRGPTENHVEAAMAQPVDQVHDALAARLPEALRRHPNLRLLVLAPVADGLLPDDVQLLAAAADNPALGAYAAADAAERRRDFFLSDLSDEYRPSEYFWRGRPAPFQTDFIVRLQPAAAGGTRLEIVEYRPRVRLGKRFDLRGHHGPGFYCDIRFVAPTVRDRRELLALVVGLLDG